MRILLVALLLSASALAGCADGDGGSNGDGDGSDDGSSSGTASPSPTGSPGPAAAPVTYESVMRNNDFVPADFTLNVGDTVHWTTEDVQAHNVVSESEAASFRSEDISIAAVPGVYTTEFSYTFQKAGTVDYVCEYHSGMVGTITVVGSNQTSS